MASLDIKKLYKSPMFDHLTEAELTAFSAVFTQRSLGAGTTIFVENMAGESLYLIGAGTVQISCMLAEGEERTLVVLGPDDIFGELAILQDAPRSSTARVMEDVDLYCLSRADFAAFCDEHQGTGLKLLRNVMKSFCDRLRQNREEYREMVLLALNERGFSARKAK